VPPRTLGPYEILSFAGRGGVGTVYRARDRRSGRLAALKLLPPPPIADPSSARRLAREFEALAALDHRNVVRVLEAGVSGGYSFVAMELVEGLGLRSYLSPAFDSAAGPAPSARGAAEPFPVSSGEPDTEGLPPVLERGPGAIRAFAPRLDEPDTAGPPGRAPSRRAPARRAAPPARGAATCLLSREALDRLNAAPRVARIRGALAQVCAGLAYLHRRGLVHRDLKPANIMVDDLRCVRIMDFGLVKLPHEAPGPRPPHPRVVGTYRYMAPEQARGLAVDGRADLYSLGVILFETLCGRPPFVAQEPAELWEEITSRPPPPVAALNPGANRALAGVAARLLAKDPAERFQLAEQVGEAILH
jgi:serine/threonine protein kinase